MINRTSTFSSSCYLLLQLGHIAVDERHRVLFQLSRGFVQNHGRFDTRRTHILADKALNFKSYLSRPQPFNVYRHLQKFSWPPKKKLFYKLSQTKFIVKFIKDTEKYYFDLLDAWHGSLTKVGRQLKSNYTEFIDLLAKSAK